ncbi:protein-l-isoaspartate o-methyltransferase domain-containing protein 1, partial [Nannochloropsis oceanica]
KERGEGEG